MHVERIIDLVLDFGRLFLVGTLLVLGFYILCIPFGARSRRKDAQSTDPTDSPGPDPEGFDRTDERQQRRSRCRSRSRAS